MVDTSKIREFADAFDAQKDQIIDHERTIRKMELDQRQIIKESEATKALIAERDALIPKLRAEIERLKSSVDSLVVFREKYNAYQDTPEAKERAVKKAKDDAARLAKELAEAQKRVDEMTPKE